MLTPLGVPLTRCDVVTCGRFRGVMWTVDASGVTLLPIAAAVGPLHRGDADVDEIGG